MDTAGILELGGASAQIAFQHDDDILADKFPVTIGGEIYPLYVHSYLGFGQEWILEKVRELAVERETEVDGEVPNPCMIDRRSSYFISLTYMFACLLQYG